ncbi:methyltransferase domain-containing protein [Hoyosella sp. YIM 151337]|uniref:class I SAM-dependent methyltransferase n=1 Tax=Hoyosella sp. YIM 151337 TaxID=2992742 RepID=UPI0022358673|nr:methyltransferase domain-containing protein [Hoyosella sp. YIM 151337]MCW4354196.1 methyltransferase domain-containing protein [Hoyosella sp. YIM 151337]
MTAIEKFQVSLEAAEAYEDFFVPGIFAEWAPLIVEATGVSPGQAVLDVACGTGIAARTAADALGANGTVVGTDLNESMLTVARRVRPDLTWQQADAQHLPYPDKSFDVVICQMGLMFVDDRVAALSEMARVVTDDGKVGVVVPSKIENQPAYSRLTDIVADEAGPEGAALLSTYWSCGDADELTSALNSAGLRVATVKEHPGTASFPSVDALVKTEIEGSPLYSRISEQAYQRIRERARNALGEWETNGRLHAPLLGLVVCAEK